MNKIKVHFKKLTPKAKTPSYSTEHAAGADLYACLEEAVTIVPGETAFIHTGLAVEIPEGMVGLIYARSGLACKKGLAPANKVGVIDSDYRGNLGIPLFNDSDEPQIIEPHERVAQMVIQKPAYFEIEVVDSLEPTECSDNGFGSTGR